jgi:hypothetical protein
MARSSHLMQVARRAAVGVPVLAPPRSLFPRWGTVAPLSESDAGGPAPDDRAKAPAAARRTARPMEDSSKTEPATQSTSGAPRTAVQPPGPKAHAFEIARAKMVATTDPVTPVRPTVDGQPDQPAVKVPPPASNHPVKEAAPLARRVDKAATPVARFSPVMEKPAAALVASLPDRGTNGSGTVPVADHRAVSIAPRPSRPAAIPQPAASARVALPQLTPHQPLPATPLPPPVRSRESNGPVIRIGSVEVHIVAPAVAPQPVVRQAAAAAASAPLSRELISSFGLRQG